MGLRETIDRLNEVVEKSNEIMKAAKLSKKSRDKLKSSQFCG